MTLPQLVEVRVQQGILRGQRITPEDGGLTYDAFRGVPFAQKPVGPLRFKAPRPPESWEGARPALDEGPNSVQLDFFDGMKPSGREDCLYLNVYTPQVPSSVAPTSPERKNGSPWPIMVWFHPGGFANGSGSTRDYGPELLVGKDVVVVTVNYRLGALGFLSLNSPAATGNYGLKDAIAALRWIKKNGSVFGGDLDRITIFGCSAGSSLVQLLQISPAANNKGLFHRAIAQSGSSLNPWASTSSARERALRLATQLGATASDLSDDEKILEFLREQPAIDILEATDKIMTKEDSEAGLTFMFLPTVEEVTPDDPEDEVFLPKPPRELLKEGGDAFVPLITGVTDMEGLLVELTTSSEKGIKPVPENLERYKTDLALPEDLKDVLPPGSEKRKEAAENLRKLYFKGGDVPDKTPLGYYDLQSDLMFLNGVLQEARIHARQSSNPVWVYLFRVQGKINKLYPLLGLKESLGACHGDELNYLWNTSPPMPPIPKLEPDSLEARTRERLVTMWTNFAKTGNPTPEGDPVLEGLQWPTLSQDVGSSIKYLNINEELSVQEGLFEERVRFWDSLYSHLK